MPPSIKKNCTQVSQNHFRFSAAMGFFPQWIILQPQIILISCRNQTWFVKSWEINYGCHWATGVGLPHICHLGALWQDKEDWCPQTPILLHQLQEKSAMDRHTGSSGFWPQGLTGVTQLRVQGRLSGKSKTNWSQLAAISAQLLNWGRCWSLWEKSCKGKCAQTWKRGSYAQKLVLLFQLKIWSNKRC